jgi:hypothetical protein
MDCKSASKEYDVIIKITVGVEIWKIATNKEQRQPVLEGKVKNR